MAKKVSVPMNELDGLSGIIVTEITNHFSELTAKIVEFVKDRISVLNSTANASK